MVIVSVNTNSLVFLLNGIVQELDFGWVLDLSITIQYKYFYGALKILFLYISVNPLL